MRMQSGLAVLVASVVLAGCGAALQPAADTGGTSAAAPPSITVQGEAKVPVPNSTATFVVGVQQQAGTAADALSQDNAKMAAVIGALKKGGVGDKDLTTQNLSVYPQYAGGPNQAPRITGFQASDMLQVRVTDVAKVGPLIDTAMAAGANQINSVSFGPPDDDTLNQQALAAAVDNARARAAAIAKAAHLTLGQATVVTTQVQTPPVRTLSGAAYAAQDLAAPTPVQAGDQQVTATVTVTFRAG